MHMSDHRIFITGATGYIGSRLIPILLGSGHEVTALAREQSRHKLPPGCAVAIADALNGDSYAAAVRGADTFIHLVGVSHPSPSKAQEFLNVDQRSAEQAIQVARQNGIEHFVYLSVAQPAPMMHAYIEVRAHCENVLRASGMNATILRPWYVLGPGHRWPYALIPFYKLAELFPKTRGGARRLGLVTISDMLKTIAAAVANPPSGVRLIEAPEIRKRQQLRSRQGRGASNKLDSDHLKSPVQAVKQ